MTHLAIYIIYTPGTVRQLLLFVPSLMRHAPGCRFRLVSNGCDVAERSLLRQLADRSEHLEVVILPWTQLVSHGQALTWLQQRETSDRFAFMDSDIFATGPFLDEALAALHDCAAVFSCPPVWSHPEEETLPAHFSQASGVYNHLDDGTLIGSSYFAIYDQRRLQKVMDETGVDFRLYRWCDVPEALRDGLRQRAHHKRLYDTGKLLNLMLLEQDHITEYRRLDHLQHVGGISGETASPHNVMRSLRTSVKKWGLLTRDALRRSNGHHLPAKRLAEFNNIAARQQTRGAVAIYFHQLLTSLLDDRPTPASPRIGDELLEQRIRTMSAQVRTIVDEDTTSCASALIESA